MIRCYSYRQSCELGLVPPRMPDRADAQVPHEPATGRLVYGRVGHFYFYDVGGRGVPAFGFIDIEIAAQYVGQGRVLLEAYAIGDGYQSCCGNGEDAPLSVELYGADGLLASAQWDYGAILCGHADPVALRVELNLSEAEFDRLERAVLPAIAGSARPCV